METDTLCMAIKQFAVKIVLVLDNEKLEKDIQTYLRSNNLADVIVVKVPKSPGIQSHSYRSN
jgi:nitrate reductase NapAB chaperone NapD